MGKLHTLKRAVERNPESWLYDYDSRDNSYRVRGTSRTGSNPIVSNFVDGKWVKQDVGKFTYYPFNVFWSTGHRYEHFVVSVLKKLGYKIRRNNF